MPREPCAEGPEGVQRRTCLFTDWPDYEKPEPSDYLEDDGYIETGILQTKSEPTPLPGWALVRSKLCRSRNAPPSTPPSGATSPPLPTT